MRILLAFLLLISVSLASEVKVYAVVIGKVEKVLVREGDMVKEGELLMKIEDRIYEARKKRFKGELKSAEASYKKIKRDYDRLKELFDRDLLSLTRLEDQEVKLLSAEGKIEEVKGRIEEVEILKEYTNIYAPVSGRIKRVLVGEGSYVNGIQIPQVVVIIEKQ